MKVIELILDDEQVVDGVNAISIVGNPAMESHFVALKNHKTEFKTVDKEKRILLGAALIPNKPIMRNQELDGVKQPFYCYFSKATVEQASQLYLLNGNQNNATLEHKTELEGLTMVESWIKVDAEKDKSVAYGLNDPVGTWYLALKVNNEEVWKDYVKTGKVKGFSIEGYFADRSVEMKVEDVSTIEKIKDLLDEHFNNVTL